MIEYNKLDTYRIYSLILILVNIGCQLVIVSLKYWFIMDLTETTTGVQQAHSDSHLRRSEQVGLIGLF